MENDVNHNNRLHWATILLALNSKWSIFCRQEETALWFINFNFNPEHFKPMWTESSTRDSDRCFSTSCLYTNWDPPQSNNNVPTPQTSAKKKNSFALERWSPIIATRSTITRLPAELKHIVSKPHCYHYKNSVHYNGWQCIIIAYDPALQMLFCQFWRSLIWNHPAK